MHQTQARRNEIDIGGPRVKWGLGDLAVRKFLETSPFISLEKAPFVKIALFNS